jgi:lysophospholipase L1-like esterase
MNWTRFGLVILAICVLAAIIVRTRKAEAVGEHRAARQLVLHYTLSRVDDPVIVVGDSIVEASTLPRSTCGHAIINAGLNGASTASDLGNWLTLALDGKRASLIVVSLGTNDALVGAPPSKESFGERYGALLAQLAGLSPRLAVLEILPVEARARMSAEMRDKAMETIRSYNSILSEVAARNGATFIALPAMPTPHTIDGVHLNAGGSEVWEQAVMRAVAMICG